MIRKTEKGCKKKYRNKINKMKRMVFCKETKDNNCPNDGQNS